MIDENRKFESSIEDKLFKKRLKYLYKKIDSKYNLFWTHENHLLGKRLRSEIQKDKPINNSKDSFFVQTEIIEVSIVITNLYVGIFHQLTKFSPKYFKLN